jgi:hypothetical protein
MGKDNLRSEYALDYPFKMEAEFARLWKIVI